MPQYATVPRSAVIVPKSTAALFVTCSLPDTSDGVFVSVGRQPATALAVGQLALDGGGYIVAGETTETSIPGVYAVGDVRTKPLRQVVTAVADGAVAVHMAEKYIAENR